MWTISDDELSLFAACLCGSPSATYCRLSCAWAIERSGGQVWLVDLSSAQALDQGLVQTRHRGEREENWQVQEEKGRGMTLTV